jgi:hypothetical protein
LGVTIGNHSRLDVTRYLQVELELRSSEDSSSVGALGWIMLMVARYRGFFCGEDLARQRIKAVTN